LSAQIGLRIRELRRDRAWTQRDLAARANLTLPQLSRYENGARRTHVGVLIRIARSFGVLVDLLLPQQGDIPPDPVDAELLKRIRRLAALGAREKQAAIALLDVILAHQLLFNLPPTQEK